MRSVAIFFGATAMLEFRSVEPNGWRASIGLVALFVDDDDGRPDRTQSALADRLAARVNALEEQAGRYLDLFVDRARASGRDGEAWWFEDIELLGLAAGAFQLSFTLEGDDGGLWIVEMIERHGCYWPVRLERRQG